MELVEKVVKGNARAAAKLITLIENDTPMGREALEELHRYTGRAYIIGITGPAGSGKSTLTNEIAKGLIRQGKKVGIIAVDPTSPFTGGAILGDRIRMQEIATDPNIFIRSMGTRGSLGGLSRKVKDAVKVLDAFGKEYILIETVGVGQSEIDIVKNADATIVVSVPNLGDDIQTIKAGIMEIGDILVVNKSDLPGAKRVALELQSMLDLAEGKMSRRPPIIQVSATEGVGMGELLAAIENFRKYQVSSGQIKEVREKRLQQEIAELVVEEIQKKIEEKVSETDFAFFVKKIMNKEENPYTIVEYILDKILVSSNKTR
jgi:LAO/AO transport system kinase